MTAIVQYLRSLFRKPASQQYPTDYGHGYTARQMIDGSWVLWHGESACDLQHMGFRWKPGTRFFSDCLGTREDVDRAAPRVMAAFGVFANDPNPQPASQ